MHDKSQTAHVSDEEIVWDIMGSGLQSTEKTLHRKNQTSVRIWNTYMGNRSQVKPRQNQKDPEPSIKDHDRSNEVNPGSGNGNTD